MEHKLVLIMWDTETSGLSTVSQDIIQIGAIATVVEPAAQPGTKHLRVVSTFDTFVATKRSLQATVHIHKIHNVDLEDADPLEQVMERWYEQMFAPLHRDWPGCRIYMCAHNGDTFDWPMLFSNCKRLSNVDLETWLRRCRVTGSLDTLRMLRGLQSKLRFPSASLGKVFHFLTGRPVPKDAHNALVDCQMMVDVLNSDALSTHLNRPHFFLQTYAQGLAATIKKMHHEVAAKFLRQDTTTPRTVIEIPAQPLVQFSRFNECMLCVVCCRTFTNDTWQTHQCTVIPTCATEMAQTRSGDDTETPAAKRTKAH